MFFLHCRQLLSTRNYTFNAAVMAEVAVRMREVSRSEHARYAGDIREMISAMDDVVSRVDTVLIDAVTSEQVRDTIKASGGSNECVGLATASLDFVVNRFFMKLFKTSNT